MTLGKWRVNSGMVETETGVPVCYMAREPGNGTLPVERDDNATAIAALPEFIELARLVKGFFERAGTQVSTVYGGLGYGILLKAQKAIAKAGIKCTE